MSTRLLTFCATVCVSGALVACGGDEDSLPETPVVTPTTETTVAEESDPVPREEFITEGDAICSELLGSLTAVDAAATDAGDQFGGRAELYEDLLNELQALGTPDDDTGLAELYESGAELVTAYEGAQVAADAGDDTTLVAAEESAESAQSDFGAAASGFGFTSCGDETATTDVPTTSGEPVPTDPVTPVPTEPVPEPAPVEPVPEPVPVEPVPEPVPVEPSGGAGATAPEPSDPGGSSISGGFGPG